MIILCIETLSMTILFKTLKHYQVGDRARVFSINKKKKKDSSLEIFSMIILCIETLSIVVILRKI